jgi:DNA-binding NarL/FixJ family response regulator
MIRVFISDDHVMFAEGLESLLAGEADFRLVGKAVNATETLKQVLDLRPDVLLLDINLPDQSGFEVCRTLRAEAPEVKIMALSMFSEESYITGMLELGAQGYVLKNTGKEELCTAIKTLAEGRTYFCREVTEVIMRGLVQRKADEKKEKEKPVISRREKEVLRHIVDERTTQEIASILFISEKTVESHRAALSAKLGARNIAGLVKAAIQWGLLEE